MSSLILQLNQFVSDDIEKVSSIKPKKGYNRGHKKTSPYYQRLFLIIKTILFSAIIIALFIDIRYQLNSINNLKINNANLKIKIQTLDNNIQHLQINITDLSSELNTLETNKQNLLTKHSETLDNYNLLSSKIKQLESKKNSLNSELSFLIEHIHSLQIQLNDGIDDPFKFDINRFDLIDSPIHDHNYHLDEIDYLYHHRPHSRNYGLLGRLRLNDPFIHYRYDIS